MIKLLIIADDFTGALDTGVQFATAKAQTLVTTNCEYDFQTGDQPEVLVMDVETRHINAKAAYDIVFHIVKKAVEIQVPYIIKKTDSALRGNIGAELQALLEASERKELPFIPAFPKMNRYTKKGIHYIGDEPVSESVFGKDPFEPVKYSYIPDIIGEQSNMPVRECFLDQTGIVSRNEVSTNWKGITLYDVSSAAELHQIAEVLFLKGDLHIMAGCAGLATEFQSQLEFEGNDYSKHELKEKFLVVCGSVNPITKKQLDYGEAHGMKRILFSPEQKLNPNYWDTEDGNKKLEELSELIRTEQSIIFDSNDPKGTQETLEYAEKNGLTIEDVRFRISTTLGVMVKGLIEKGIEATMLLTGGDTLLGFMNQMKVTDLMPVKELDPGTVLSEFYHEEKKYNIISKSGGFGKEELLITLMEKMKEERQNVD